MKHFPPSLAAAPLLDGSTYRILVRVACLAAFMILASGVFWEVFSYDPAHRGTSGPFSLFGEHENLTSWYQAMLLSLSSFLWLIIARTFQGGDRRLALLASGVLFYMSAGEHTNFDHEFSARLIGAMVPVEQASFVLLGLAAMFCAGMWGLFSPLVGRTAALGAPLAFAFATYVAGAVGLEVLAVTSTNMSPVYFVLLGSAEEILETLGVLMFCMVTAGHLTLNARV